MSEIGQSSEVKETTTPVAPAIDGLRARAILLPGDEQVYTYDRTEDPRSALARGLKEPLEVIAINWVGGRLLRFRAVHVSWGDPEDPGEYPSLGIVGIDEGIYEANTMTPRLIKVEGKDNRFLKQASELRQQFSLLVWSTDRMERSGFVAAIEDMLEPAEFMTGLRLELPYYFNARATYEKNGITYDDGVDTNNRRWRRAAISVTANLEQLVPIGDLPYGSTRLQGTVTDGSKVPVPAIPGDPPLNVEAVLVRDD